MGHLPLVSVLMPAYNAGKHVAAALESAIAQTYPNVEIIVVDDGSTDRTPEVLERYRDKGVQVIHQQHRGQSAARNAAFSMANGSLLKFLDADDLLSAEHVALQVARLGAGRRHVASAEWARFYEDTAEALFEPEPVWRDMAPVDWIVTSLTAGASMMQCGLWLIPRAVLDAAGPWDERLSLIDDFDFIVRVLLASDGVVFTPGAQLYYRSGLPSSLSASRSRAAFESAFLSISLGTRRLLEAEQSDRTRRVCADVWQSWVYQFFPEHPDLVESAERRVAELGGSTLPLPSGALLRYLNALVGWRRAKRIQRVAYRAGYEGVAAWKGRRWMRRRHRRRVPA